MKEIGEGNTVREAKDYLRENWRKGTKCPCCNQNVKLYPRTLNSSMAYGLIILYRLHIKHADFNKWFKMNEEVAKLKIPSSNIEYAKTYYWGLIEERGSEPGKKRTSGLWRLTARGIKFVRKEIEVNKRVYVYNNKVWEYSKDFVSITDALGNKFNYLELINNYEGNDDRLRSGAFQGIA